jgi:hypothetical protein
MALIVTLFVRFNFFERASKSFSTGSEISGAVSKLTWVVVVSGVGCSSSGVVGLHKLSNSNGEKLVLANSTGSRSAGSAPNSRLLLR